MKKSASSSRAAFIIPLLFVIAAGSCGDPVAAKRFTITATVSPEGAGNVDLNPRQADYEMNCSVTIHAEPSDDHHFSNWSGDMAGSDDLVVVHMDSDKTVIAVFGLNCAADAYESNDASGSAFNLGTVDQDDPAGAWQAAVMPQGDVDWFAIYAREDGGVCVPFTKETFRLEVRMTPPAGEDYDLSLYGDGGALLAESAAAGTGEEYIVFDWDGACGAEDSRSFRVKVEAHASSWDCSEYTISIGMSEL